MYRFLDDLKCIAYWTEKKKKTSGLWVPESYEKFELNFEMQNRLALLYFTDCSFSSSGSM